RQTSGGLADAEQLEAECCAPIVQRWLLEPRFAVESWRDPVSGFHHVARDPGVARLVRADEANGIEGAEIANVKSGEDKNKPANAADPVKQAPGLWCRRVRLHRASLARGVAAAVQDRRPLARDLRADYSSSANLASS